MKKIILIVLITFLFAGCTTNLAEVNEGVGENITIVAGTTPEVEELVTAKENVELTKELAGDVLIVEAKKNKKIQTIEFKIDYETVEIDGTAKVDLSQFYTDQTKLSKVSYSFNDDETIMTVTDENGEEAKTFDIPVSVTYPSYTIADDIVIDTYVGYDINDFVTADEGVEVTSELNENILTITLSKGIWSETLKKEVTLEDSSPMTIHKKAQEAGYPLKYCAIGMHTCFTFLNDTECEVSGIGAGGDGVSNYDENSIDWYPTFLAGSPQPNMLYYHPYTVSEDGSYIIWNYKLHAGMADDYRKMVLQ